MFQQTTTQVLVARAKRFHVAVTTRHVLPCRFVCCFCLLIGSVGLLHLEAQESSPATAVNCFGFTSSDPSGLRRLLRYTTPNSTWISAHRGGAQQGFPENCIATFQHSLQHGCTMLEVDPRLTKDGQIVLHHDSTLDRTTSGSGPLKQKSLAELKQLTLTDLDGNPTKYQMPTLEETIQWSRGKTVLVLDQKDVPLKQRIDAITKHHAEGFVMLIISSVNDALQVHQSNPNIVMELMVMDVNRVQAIDQSGIPWDRIIAFVGHKPPTDKPLIDAIHQRGAMCMAGTSRHLDKELTKQGSSDIDLRKRYHDLIAFGIDVIETDLPIQVHQVLE
jgi:glycerophosphoryl diester phosphodiesterase